MDVNIIKGKSVLTNSGNNYSGTLSVGDTALINGGIYLCKIPANNTDAITLDLNSIGAKNVYTTYGTTLFASQIRTNGWYEFLYDSDADRFILLNSEVGYDTGWVTLSGFDFIPSGDRPKYRVIGRQLLFYGTVIIPLSNDGGATLVAYTNEASYLDKFFVAPYVGTSGGVSINPLGSIVFNQGNPVIPNNAHYPDLTYSLPSLSTFAMRRINSDTGSKEILYVAPVSLSITSGGALAIGTLYDLENLNGTDVGHSPWRFLTSNAVAGDYAVNFRSVNTNDTLHGITANTALPLDITQQTFKHQVTLDGALAENLGGFGFSISHLKGFLAPI